MPDASREPLTVHDLDVVVSVRARAGDAVGTAARDAERRTLLAGVLFVLEPGEALQITGPSGSGKSTLLRTVATLHGDAGGNRVRLGESTPALLGFARWRRRVSYSHPSLRLRETTIEEVLRRPFSYKTSVGAFDRARAESDLESLGLAGSLDRDPRELSSGEAQRVALIRAVAHEPDVALLDEPFSHLDDASRGLALDWLEGARARGMSLLIASHGALPMAQLDISRFAAAPVVVDGGTDA